MKIKDILIIVGIIFIAIFIMGLFREHHAPEPIKEKIKTLTVYKDNTKLQYITEKKYIQLWDTLYVGGKDTICDSLVYHLKKEVKNCDTIINIQDTIIEYQDKFIAMKPKKDLINVVVGPGIAYTPTGIQPFIGITVGIKIK